MTGGRYVSIAFPVLLALAMLAASLLLLSSAMGMPGLRVALAQGPTVRYVAPGGDCAGVSPCYAAIQDAVDAASDGDTIKVAQGVYTSTGFQVVYINRAITLTGGYTTADWVNSYPLTRPTVIDTESAARRRGVYIDGTGIATITLAGLTIQRGYTEDAQGSGVYILTGTVVLRDSWLQNNRAWGIGRGGGVYGGSGTLILRGNVFRGNSSGWDGGGVYLAGGIVTMSDNFLEDNQAARYGGSVYAAGSTVVSSNTFHDNWAGYGGGVYVGEGAVILNCNTFEDNSSNFGGGGMYVGGGTTTLDRNHFQSNSTQGRGGALYVSDGIITLSNNTIISNTAGTSGSAVAIAGGTVIGTNDIIANSTSTYEGVYLSGGTLTARHWTLADNGNYALTTSGGAAVLINTIVASHTLGGFWGSNIVADHTLFFNSGTLCGGGASCTNNLSGDPRFINPAVGDYHIGPDSAAIDAGVDAHVTTDIDSESRPLCFGYDIGADELMPSSPVASFTSSSPDWVGQETVFSNTTFVTGCVSYLWAFGDRATSTAVSPAHTYTAPGTYTVVLSATNDAGSSVATGAVTIYAVAFTSSSPDWLSQTTAFTNTTVTNGTTTYIWSFGNGVTSTLESPTHTYASPGSYTVVLTATNFAGSGAATGTVIIYSPPTPDFTAYPTEGFRPLTVAFTDTTTTTPLGDPTLTYLWRFGDGEISDLPNPTHTYTAAGVYTVTLTVSNAAGSDTVTRTRYITVNPVPVQADFAASPTSGLAPLTVVFTNTSTGDYTASLWDFGDEVTSTLESPTHTYAVGGFFTVTLTVSGPGGNDTLTRGNYITVYTPVQAAFTAWPTSGLAPLTVAFINTSTGDYTASLWDFGDGVTCTLESPTHTYTTAGVCTVVLMVSGPGGIDTLIRTSYITVYAPVQAGFIASPTSGVAPLTVVFTNTSTGDYTASLWDFGDGMTSTLESSTHTYMVAGVYTVTLTVSGPGGSDTETKAEYITVWEEYNVYLPLILRRSS